MKPAPIFKRLLAYVIDSILLGIIVGFFAEALKTPAFTTLRAIDKVVNMIPGQETSQSFKLATKASSYVGIIITLMIISGLLHCAYFVLFERSKWQGTLGKKLLKLKVVDGASNPLSLLKALKRYLIFSAPSFAIYFVGSVLYPQCLTMQKQLMMLDLDSIVLCLWSIVWVVVASLLWVIPIFFTKNKATAYDILSKTKVVG